MVPKITIIKVRRSEGENINRELQWIGNSLGLFNLRDKDSSCFRIFISLVKRARRNEHLSSDTIADRLNLTRGTVVHHLNKLMESGIVIRSKEGYLLRESHLARVVKDIKRDMDLMMEEIQEVAQDIDNKLG